MRFFMWNLRSVCQQGCIHMNVPCPICKGEAREDHSNVLGDEVSIECPRCGSPFRLGGRDYSMRKQPESKPLHVLSGVLRHASERRERLPQLKTHLTSSSVKELVDGAPTPGEDRAKRLLEAIHRRAPHPGSDVATLTHGIDYPLAYATDGKELRSYLDHLCKKGWIEIRHADETTTSCTLTVDGLMVVETVAAS